MINIIAFLVAFILICQIVIILFYMCGRRRLNRYFYNKWVKERNDRNMEEENDEENSDFYA